MARDEVEEGRLAGAVGTDHGMGLAGLELERDVAGGDEAVEALPQTLDAKHGRHGERALRYALNRATRPIRPSGSTRTITSRISPSTVGQYGVYWFVKTCSRWSTAAPMIGPTNE